MAIALAEAEKYEILERIGNSNQMHNCCSRLCYSNLLVYRVRLLWHHSQSQAEKRWICKSLGDCFKLIMNDR